FPPHPHALVKRRARADPDVPAEPDRRGRPDGSGAVAEIVPVRVADRRAAREHAVVADLDQTGSEEADPGADEAVVADRDLAAGSIGVPGAELDRLAEGADDVREPADPGPRPRRALLH